MLNHFIDTERLIHSFKTALACIIGFIITKLINLPADQWVVITIIVVMCAQLYVGSVMQKAYLRFLGTFLGCLFATTVILSLGTSSISIGLMIGLATFIFSYMATSQENLSYAGSLGAVTTAIILIGQEPTLTVVIERFIEISIGIVIATVISQFFIPINARTHLRRKQAATLEQIHDFYISTMIKHNIRSDAEYQDLDEAIVKSLSKQRQLAVESAHEPLGEKFSAKHFIETLYAERGIIRAIAFMHSAYLKIADAPVLIDKLADTRAFHQTVENDLSILVRVLENEKPTHEHIHLPNLAKLRQALHSVVSNNDPEQLIYIDGYLYAAELLTESLENIAKLYGVQVY